MSTSPTTELDAINTMLSCITEAPISDLDTTGSASVNTAKNVLNEVNRAVQQRGWHFNSEENYPLVRNSNNEIYVPANTLRVCAAEDYLEMDVVQRGNRLYDRKNHTYTFDKNIKVDIVFCLPFSDLPEAARRYITIVAARVFQGRIQGSEAVYRFTSEEVAQALKDLHDAEGDTAKHNIFTDSASMREMVDRWV